MFDLQEDPFETCNLAAEKGQKKRIAGLRRVLRNLKEKYADSDRRWGKIFWDGWKLI